MFLSLISKLYIILNSGGARKFLFGGGWEKIGGAPQNIHFFERIIGEGAAWLIIGEA